MAGLVLTGASYVRPVTPFCRPNSMRSLGSCCKLFRQAALVNRTNSAGFDATTRRAFALPRAALSRRSKEASRNVDTDGDGAADNKVPCWQEFHPLLMLSKVNFSQLTFRLTAGKGLGGDTQGPQLSLRSRHYHAARQCRTSKTVSCTSVGFPNSLCIRSIAG